MIHYLHMLVFFSVLYNPSHNLINSLRKAINHGFYCIVYINTVDHQFMQELEKMDVVILGNNKNVGLGLAFYELENFMVLQNFEYFIYFDQDTIVDDNAWTSISSSYLTHFENKDIGILHYSNSYKVKPKLVINSGSLFSINILKQIGFHDKTYFVECVDYEFCLRLKINNLKIISIKCDGIDHESMQDGFSRNILFIKVPLRIYHKERMKDFNNAHFRLLENSLRRRLFSFSFYFLKSIVRQNVMEFVSKLFKKQLCY